LQRISFAADNIFCFHIRWRQFQHVDVFGDNFPQKLGWYFTFPMQIPPAATSHSSSSPLYPAAALSSVVICGWMEWANETFVPEVWHMELTPIDRIRKLDIAPIVDRLDSQLDTESDLRTAVMIGDRLLLLGSRPEGPANESDLRYNVYFEVPLRRLCTGNKS
jgi:hypothetical protein